MLSPGKGLSFSTHPSWRTPRTPGITPHLHGWTHPLEQQASVMLRAPPEEHTARGVQSQAGVKQAAWQPTSCHVFWSTSCAHRQSAPPNVRPCARQGGCNVLWDAGSVYLLCLAWDSGTFLGDGEGCFSSVTTDVYRSCSHSILFIPIFNSPWLEEFSAFPLVHIPPSLSPCLGRVAHLLQWTYKPKSTVYVRVHSSCSFCGLGQMYNDSIHHDLTKCLHCLQSPLYLPCIPLSTGNHW